MESVHTSLLYWSKSHKLAGTPECFSVKKKKKEFGHKRFSEFPYCSSLNGFRVSLRIRIKSNLRILGFCCENEGTGLFRSWKHMSQSVGQDSVRFLFRDK